ncbi:hypothetical protein BBJ29_007147 [Phytophthora kernoviae]|uniref:TOG domain-containing protein n=1 Tax=Phytophthora kernoviae TaxID=325452 RepID=A0A421FXA0_9STRA|nr:hypothetical protein BBJ29_007147 [Phytophthora kernoviae]
MEVETEDVSVGETMPQAPVAAPDVPMASPTMPDTHMEAVASTLSKMEMDTQMGSSPGTGGGGALSVDDVLPKLSDKNWKVRKEGFEQAKTLFEQPGVKTAQVRPMMGMFNKMCEDANASAMEAGIAAVLAYTMNVQPFDKEIVAGVMARVTDKGFSSRPGIVKICEELTDAFIAAGAAEETVTALLEGTNSRKPKVPPACLACTLEALKDYGPRIVPLQAIKTALPKLLEGAVKVRPVAMNIMVEIHRWTGPALVQDIVANLRPAQQTEFEGLTKDITVGQAAPTKFVRGAKLSGPAASAGRKASGGASGVAATPAAAAFDPRDFAETVDLLAKLLKTEFKKKLELPKWSEKVEALKIVLELIGSVPKLANGDYYELVSTLKPLTNDSNVNIAAKSVEVLGALSDGLRKNFTQHARVMFPEILRKLSDKKSVILNATNKTLDLFLQHAMSIDMMMDDLKLACDASKNKSPPARVQTMGFMARAVENRYVDLNDKALVVAFGSLFMKGIDDTDPTVRKAGQESFIVLLKATDQTGAWLQNMMGDIARKNPRAHKAIQQGVEGTGASVTPEEAEEVIAELQIGNWGAIQEGFDSSKWMERKGAIESLEEYARTQSSMMSMRVIEAFTVYLAKQVKEFKDSNINVLKSSFQAVGTFAENVASKFPRGVVCLVVPRACDKIGDRKASEAIRNMIIQLCEATSPAYTTGCLIEYMPKVRTPLAHIEALTVLSECVTDFGLSICNPRALVDYAKGPLGLEASNPKVRSGATSLLSAMYSQLGPALLPILNLESWKPALAATVETEFKKVGFDPSKAMASVKRQVKYQDENQAAADPGALFGRVDVSNQITKELLDDMKNESDKVAWKKRAAAMDTVQAICEGAACAIEFTRPVQEVLRSLKARLNDSNANLKVKAANVIAVVATSIGPDVAKGQYNKWVFETTSTNEMLSRKGEVETEWKPFLSPELQAKLFAPSLEKGMLAAMDDLMLCVLHQPDEVVSSLDLILKWCTLRIVDNNVQALAKLLEVLVKLFEMLKTSGYQLDDVEAAILLPYLLQESGQSKPRFRIRFRDVMKLVVDVYNPEKYVPHLMECFNGSKNTKSRCECIDLIEYIVSVHGYQVIGRRCIKDVGKYVVAHEKELRESAINTLVAVYMRTDGGNLDKFFRFAGVTTQQGIDLLNARLKHLPTSSFTHESSAPVDEEQVQEQEPPPPQQQRSGFGFARASAVPAAFDQRVAGASASQTLVEPVSTGINQFREELRNDDVDMSVPNEEDAEEEVSVTAAIEELLLRPIEMLITASKEVVPVGTTAYKEGGNALKGLYAIINRPSDPSEIEFLHSYVNEILLALCDCIHGAFYAGNAEKRPEMYILAMSLTTLTVVLNSDAVEKIQRYTVERVLLELCSKIMDPRMEKFSDKANLPTAEMAMMPPEEKRFLMVFKALYKAMRKLTERAKAGDVYPSVINLLQRLMHNDVGDYNKNDTLKHLLKEDSLDQLVGRILIKLSNVQANSLNPFEGIDIFGVLMQMHMFFSTLPGAEVMMVDIANDNMQSALRIIAESLMKTRPNAFERHTAFIWLYARKQRFNTNDEDGVGGSGYGWNCAILGETQLHFLP